MSEAQNHQALTQESDKKLYGGFWIRVGAALIDMLVLLIPMLLLSYLLLVLIAPTTHEEELFYQGIDSVLAFAIWLVYTAGFHSSTWQATLGKRALGLKVTSLEGNRISFGHAAGRYVAEILNVLTLGIGYIMVGLTSRKQGLHDMVAGTYVVRTDDRGPF
ncbi:RDD family protein [Halorhodospira halochloris]|uniref:RDD family protein n=1 Tax=Halorhodospira halochloris TaxID=1052 RepID=UPI001EE9178D|nr:RDD family protein [Halorhodospira halochloris]MCG5549582.1 RDD family protein [Halorhodospira halochloris]